MSNFVEGLIFLSFILCLCGFKGYKMRQRSLVISSISIGLIVVCGFVLISLWNPYVVVLKSDLEVGKLMRLAEKGDAQAQNDLAFWYTTFSNKENPQFEKAMCLWKMSAEQGNPQAEYALASYYLAGFHIERDYVLAYKWFNIASMHGHSLSPVILNHLEKIMTSEQVADAQRIVREWKSGKEPVKCH